VLNKRGLTAGFGPPYCAITFEKRAVRGGSQAKTPNLGP